MTSLTQLLRQRTEKHCHHCRHKLLAFPSQCMCKKCEAIVEGNIKRGLYGCMDETKNLLAKSQGFGQDDHR